MSFQNFHRKIALVLFPLLVVSALTGLIYRIGRNWFKMSNETGAVVRSIHEGKYLGEFLSPFYVLLVGLGLLLLIVSGLTMVRRNAATTGQIPKRNARWFHRIVAIILVLPLAVTALTGIGFKLTQSWFGWSKQQAQWLMDIHQGTLIFGKDHRIYYILFVGLGLLALIATGVRMLGIFGKRDKM
jgi:uncharacterized iron-regulated membrane protein